MYEFTQFDQINPLTGEGYPTGEQPPPSNDPPPTVARENWQKKNHPPEIEKKIIGVVDAILCPAAPGNPAVTVSKFDTTTYIDRAIVQLYNNTGGASELGNFSIKGKLVYQLANASSGRSGSLTWEHTDYGDIEKYGEKEIKVANEFIFSGAQVEDIGDFTKKEMKPHDMYTLGLRGFHPYFEVGDLWTLTINHSLPASTSEQELIDVDVQIRGVSYQKDSRGIGETILSVRVPSGAWSKTTSVRAKVAVSGLPNQNLSRSTIVTIAPRDNPGQADYHCEGAHDELIINSAIAKLGVSGGGTICLLKGNFYLSEISTYEYCIIILENNIEITGEGKGSTILNIDVARNVALNSIRAQDCKNIAIRSLNINIAGTYAGTKGCGIYYTSVDGITVDNCAITGALKYGVWGAYGGTNIHPRIFSNNSIYNCEIGIYATGSVTRVIGNVITSSQSVVYGIYVTFGDGVIDGNTINIIGDDSAQVIGVYTYGGGKYLITNNAVVFSGTFYTDTPQWGFCLYGTNNTANGNIVEIGGTWTFVAANGAVGGFVVGHDGTKVSNNSVTYLEEAWDINYEVAAISCTTDNNIISGNNISFSGTWDCTASVNGISIAGDYCVISGNRITGDNFTGTSIARGIYITSTYNSISVNNITNFTNTGAGAGYAISLIAGANYNNVIGNICTANDNEINDAGTGNVLTGNS